MTAADEEDPIEGPSRGGDLKSDAEGVTVEVSLVRPDAQFREAQDTDATLGGLRGIVAIEQEQIRDVRRSGWSLHIVKEGGGLVGTGDCARPSTPTTASTPRLLPGCLSRGQFPPLGWASGG